MYKGQYANQNRTRTHTDVMRSNRVCIIINFHSYMAKKEREKEKEMVGWLWWGKSPSEMTTWTSKKWKKKKPTKFSSLLLLRFLPICENQKEEEVWNWSTNRNDDDGNSRHKYLYLYESARWRANERVSFLCIGIICVWICVERIYIHFSTLWNGKIFSLTK